MPYQSCPDCGAFSVVGEGPAGRPETCERCGYVFGPTTLRPAGRSAAPRAEAPAKRGGRSVLLILGIVLGCVLLVCAGLGTLGYFVFVHEIEEPVTAADREIPITAEVLAPRVPGFRVDPSLGKFARARHLDGSRELTYEYESPDGAESTLYVYYQLGVERTTKDAQDAYTGVRLGSNIGLSKGGQVQRVDRSDLWRWGDQSQCELLQRGGKPVGNLFSARKGKRYFVLMVVGIYFNDPETIREVLDPMLKRLENYGG